MRMWVAVREAGLKVVVLASRKGGVGKTTLTGHLAVAAEQAGAGRVAIADADPQGGLAAWYDARAAQTPEFVSLERGARRTVDACAAAGFDVLIVDTPPSTDPIVQQIADLADLIVVPVRPSPHDLRAVGYTVAVVEASGRPMIFVANQVTKRARITTEAAIALSEHGAVAAPMLASRVDYATSMTDGRTVLELDPTSKSASEIRELWSYVARQLVPTKQKRRA